MPNAKDLVLEPKPRMLVVGDSGTHKTWFAAHAPGVFVFDFDKGMSIARGMDVEYETFKDAPKAAKRTPNIYGVYEYGTAWPAFINKLNEIGELIDKEEWGGRPIALDSLTTLANSAMAYVLRSTNHSGNPQIQHWGAQMQLLETVMDQLNSWPVTLIVTAHIQRNQNDLTQVIEMLPLVTGKLAGKVGLYFDEVYYAKVTGSGNKKRFTLQTESDSMHKQAKTRFGVPDGIETDWQQVWSHIEKAAKRKE